MPGLPTSYIAPEVLKEAQDLSENSLSVPDGAEVSGVDGQKGYRASWTETFDFTNVETNPSSKDNGWIVTTLSLTVAPDCESINAGKPTKVFLTTFPQAEGDKKHKYYNLHMKGYARMANILRALGILQDGDGFSPAEYFDNPESPVIGSRCQGVVAKYVKKNGDKETDIGHFTPVGA